MSKDIQKPDHQPGPAREDQMRNNPPVDVQRDGHVTATTWRNEGKYSNYYTTTFTCSWPDDQGNWSHSNSFRGTDLLRLSELSRSAYARTNELREQDRESFRQARSGDEKRTQKNQDRSR